MSSHPGNRQRRSYSTTRTYAYRSTGKINQSYPVVGNTTTNPLLRVDTQYVNVPGSQTSSSQRTSRNNSDNVFTQGEAASEQEYVVDVTSTQITLNKSISDIVVTQHLRILSRLQ
jgi:hypothetical protein